LDTKNDIIDGVNKSIIERNIVSSDIGKSCSPKLVGENLLNELQPNLKDGRSSV